MRDTAGSRFRQALAAETPLQIVGTINAYTAMMAERSGFRAIYLSGAGVANADLIIEAIFEDKEVGQFEKDDSAGVE